jgi:hypothetical protein
MIYHPQIVLLFGAVILSRLVSLNKPTIIKWLSTFDTAGLEM